ncbi:MAG: hypothetical protein ACTSWQ_01315 [Candidatus Thorarchaeota archaeon]
MSRTIEEILILIDEGNTEFYIDEEDFMVLLGHPELIKQSNVVTQMRGFLENVEELSPDMINKLVKNAEWLDASELQNYFGWILANFFWKFRDFTGFQEEYDKNPGMSNIIPSAISLAPAQDFELFHIFRIIQHTPELISKSEIKTAALSRVDEIAKVLKKGEHFEDNGLWGLWEVVLAIAKIPYLIDHPTIKETLIRQADFFAGYVFGADAGPFEGDVASPNASAMLQVRYLVRQPVLHIALAYRIKEMDLTRESLDHPEVIKQIPLLYEDPLICLHLKMKGINLDDKDCSDVTESDIESYAEALMRTKWPHVVAHGLYDFQEIYSSDVIQNAVKQRCVDIAAKIKAATNWTEGPRVYWFHDIPEILSHPQVKEAITSQIDLLMNQFNSFTITEEELNHYRNILLGNTPTPARGTITVRYREEGGKESAAYIHKDVVHVDCSNKWITHIDLDQFSNFPKMQKLSLEGNQINELDVSSLVLYQNLMELNIGGLTKLLIDPMFKFVDWCPALVKLRENISWQDYEVTSAPKLSQNMYLGWVNVENKFMSAVSEMNDMKYMLQMGMLFGLGLSQLAAFDGNLLELAVDRGKRSHAIMIMARMQDDIEKIRSDVENGISSYNDENATSPYNIRGFIDGLKALTPAVRMRAQIAYIGGLGLPELAGYDGDLVEILEALSLPEDTSFSKVTERVQEVLVEKLKNQLAHKGPTLFMDSDKMLTSMASAIAAFATHRKQMEFDETVLYEESIMDLKPLWITGWGYEVLKAMKCGLTIDYTGFEKVKSAFQRINLTLKTTTNPEKVGTTVVMSENMKQAVYWMAMDPLDRVR